MIQQIKRHIKRLVYIRQYREVAVRRLKWYIKQLFPLTYVSQFREGGKPILCIWRMWFGRCFDVRSFELNEPIGGGG